MAKKGYNKCYCPVCNNRMIRIIHRSFGKAWECVPCGYWSTVRTSRKKDI